MQFTPTRAMVQPLEVVMIYTSQIMLTATGIHTPVLATHIVLHLVTATAAVTPTHFWLAVTNSRPTRLKFIIMHNIYFQTKGDYPIRSFL